MNVGYGRASAKTADETGEAETAVTEGAEAAPRGETSASKTAARIIYTIH